MTNAEEWQMWLWLTLATIVVLLLIRAAMYGFAQRSRRRWDRLEGSDRSHATWHPLRYGKTHRGLGPRGYTRPDARIIEEVSDRLLVDEDLDASEIEVHANGGIVTLRGYVHTRIEKRLAEDLSELVPGVSDVRNELTVSAESQSRPRP